MTEALAAHRAAGKPLLDLSASNPTQCGFEYDGAAVLRALSSPFALKYEPEPLGLPSARQAVAAYYATRNIDVPVSDLVLTTSTSEAYSFIFRTLCNPGDEILVPQPGYPLFDFLAEIQDVKLVRYALVYDHGWQINFHSLEQAITPRTRAVVVVHPNNPTGHFATETEAAELNGILSRCDIAVIADEVFLDFALAGYAPPSFAANDATLTFTLSGISKICGLPQMKVAWLRASGPQRLKSEALARLEIIADTHLSMNAPIQFALPTLLDQRHTFQKQVNTRLTQNLSRIDERLASHKTCSRLKLEGGWYAVLRVPATASDEDLVIRLLTERDVLVHPGHFYEFDSDGFLVISLITAPGEFAEGIDRILSSI
ncbi:MAG TPA: pyridoxal phosphate-dependent aminotransferase [Candidatus Acidoferrales bacterium]|nr:pyridoxal phosphate-dependent aminotransferase [Candidatus Acidoferrales bacterium]